MSSEWVVAAAAVGGAAVSGGIPALLSLRQDNRRAEAERQRVEVARRDAIETEVNALCVAVAEGAAKASEGDDQPLLAALLKLSMHRGSAAEYARDWLDHLLPNPLRTVVIKVDGWERGFIAAAMKREYGHASEADA